MWVQLNASLSYSMGRTFPATRIFSRHGSNGSRMHLGLSRPTRPISPTAYAKWCANRPIDDVYWGNRGSGAAIGRAHVDKRSRVRLNCRRLGGCRSLPQKTRPAKVVLGSVRLWSTYIANPTSTTCQAGGRDRAAAEGNMGFVAR